VVECKFARRAAKQDHLEEAITGPDRFISETAARALFPQIVSRDRKLNSESDAEVHMNELLQKLHAARIEYDKPAACPS
jgi:hypothetical protein